jgi:integrase
VPVTELGAIALAWFFGLVAAGVNAKIVSERLGHSSVAFTLDTYGHVLPRQQAEAAEAVARLADDVGV